MKRLYVIAVFVLFFFSAIFCNAQIWQPLGPSDFDQVSFGPTDYTSIAVSPTGIPYVIYSDGGYKASVMKYDGNTWSYVGARRFSAGEVTSTSIAFDNSGTPYVAYSDWGNGYKATVMKYSGNSWQPVGNVGFSAGITSLNSIAFDNSGTPYVAYSDDSYDGKSVVMKYNGTAWVTVGTPGFSSNQLSYLSLAIDNYDGGIPYVVFEDNGNDNKATVMKFNGTAWEDVGTPGFSSTVAQYTSIAINSKGVPYVIYQNDLGTATVKTFDGNNWVTVGIEGFSLVAANTTSIAFDNNDNPYVSYQEGAEEFGQITVKSYNGSDWVTVGSPEFSDPAEYATIAMYGSTPYVAYCWMYNNQLAKVERYNGSSWETVGSNGVSIGRTFSTSLALNSKGVPFVIFDDITNNGTTVMEYNGVNWVQVGEAGFSGGDVQYTSIAFDNMDTVYIGYSSSGDGKASVMKYNGSSWVWVGQGGFSTGKTSFPSLVLDSNRTPYLAYNDWVNGGTTVMKYDDNSWVAVGRAGLGPFHSNYASLAIDQSGFLYFVYGDGDNSSKATVMKYADSSWTTLGNADFSAGEVDGAFIAIDSGYIPYVAYSDATRGDRATVMKYNGSSWESVGNPGFSEGAATNISIAFDRSGSPYVSYGDNDIGGEGVVMRYNGAYWVNVGNAGFTSEVTEYNSFAIDSSGTINMVYSNGGAWAYRFIPPPISTSAVLPIAYCAGSVLNVPYSVKTTINPANIFTAQLSDAKGSFANPLNIGTLTSSISGVINATIPDSTVAGTGYRVRVISSSPVDTGSDNGTNITVNPVLSPAVSITPSPSGAICDRTIVQFTAVPTYGGTSPSYQWKVNGINVGTNKPVYNDSSAVNGDTVEVVIISNPSCASITTASSNTIGMLVKPLVGTSDSITVSPMGAICSGTNVQFTVMPVNGGSTPSFQWKINGNKVGADLPNYSSNALTNGDTINLVMNSDAICATPSVVSSNIITMTVNSLPSVNVNSIKLCTGSMGTLTASGSVDYSWSPNSGLSATSGASVTVNPTVTTTYTITGANTCGTKTATAVVTVNPPLTVNVDSLSICYGSNGKLIAGGAKSYTWSPSLGLSSITGASVMVNPTITTIYTVTGTNTCSTSMATTVVIVNSLPAIIANLPSICKGSTDSLTATGSTAYSWSPAIGLNFTSGASVIANPNITTTYSVIGANNCGNTTVVMVDTLPRLTVNPIGICKGTSGILTATGATTYSWSPLPGLSSTIGASVSASPIITTTYTISGTNLCGTTTAPAIVTVDTMVTSSFTVPPSICGANNNAWVTYTGNASSGAIYNWITDGFTVANGQGPFGIGWGATGLQKISLVVINGGCESDTTSHTVQVNAAPAATFIADKYSVCVGEKVVLTYIGDTSDIVNYAWAIPGGSPATSTIIGPLTVTLNKTGNIMPSLVITTDSGCSSISDSVSIIVGDIPSVIIAKGGTVAAPTQLTANWSASTGATNYFLDVSLHSNFSTFVTGYNNLNVGNVTTYNVTGLTPGTTYYYRVRANNTCGASSNSNTITYATTTCVALVAGTVTPVSTLICPGTTQVLTLSGASGGTLQWQLSTDNINWSNVSSNGNANTYTTKTSDGNTKKYYRCLSSNACYNAASTSVIVDVSSPVITVTASNITGSSVTLNWTPVGAGNYTVTYSGTGSGSQSSATPPFTVTGLTSGSAYSFAVSQTSPAGCTATGTLTGVTTLCAAPTALKTTSVTTTSINLSWSGPTANYRVYYTQLFSSSTITKTLDVTGATTATLSSLPSGVTYEIYVARKDCPNTGNIGQLCAFIYATTTRTNTCTPPVIDSVKSLCSGQLEVWLHGMASNLYTIYLQQLTPVLQAVNSYSISGKNFTISPSGAGQTYLIAASSNCSGQLSNLTIWQAGINIPAPCNALNNLLLSAPTCVGFTASWNANNCISNTLSSYTLYVRKQGAISYGSYGVLPNTTYKVISSLAPNTTYQCFIRGAYSCGTYLVYGPASATQTITTQSAGCRLDDNNDVPAIEPLTRQTTTNDNEVFTLYPNPNTGNFIIDLSRLNTEDESVRIEVLNMLGQTVLTQLTNISNGHLNEFINMPNGTSAGMYVVKVIAGKNIYTTKVNVSR